MDIHEMTTVQSLRQCEHIQEQIWPSDRSEDLLPLHLLQTASDTGLLLGYEDDGRILGYALVLGTTSVRHVRLQSIVVRPSHGSKGIGEALIRALPQHLPDRIDTIKWLFDPLDGAAAQLSLAKTGAVVTGYRRNVYSNSWRGQNVRSDQLLAEWRPAEISRTTSDTDTASMTDILTVESDGTPCLHDTDNVHAHDGPLGVHIPYHFSDVDEYEAQWRKALRDIFTTSFQDGYKITGFHKPSSKHDDNVYILDV